MRTQLLILFSSLFLFACSKKGNISQQKETANSTYKVSKTKYLDQLEGFWLGECIGNWTGLITEMDKVGNIGKFKTGDFYTRNDWQKPDQPSIWGEGVPSHISPTIDYVLLDADSIWGSDDDTDLEYMYQHLLYNNKTSILSPQQIQQGWIKHIKKDEENFLWVSNQRAFDLMIKDTLPPFTSDPNLNPHYEMIDAQLTTEIFGLFSPGRPDFAVEMAHLPIRTTARQNAAQIAEFYISMHSLASIVDSTASRKDQIFWLADNAKERLHKNSYSRLMYDFVLNMYNSGYSWEQTRDSIYQRYQIEEKDGYHITSQHIYCNGCFAAGINFASSLVSLFFGEGNLKETIKIGTLSGWDSDNPTATWGGLIGFMDGKKKIEEDFGIKMSNKYNIHRTRQNFENNGIDNFQNMAMKGIEITNRVIQEELKGNEDAKGNWVIPKK